MMHRTKNKKLVTVAGAALVLGGTAAAFAYWSAGGSGAGTGATGTTVAITANQTSTVANMGPGDSAQPLSGKFNNPNSGPVYVTSVTASIASVTQATGAPTGTCDATDYTLAAPVMPVGLEVAAGNAQGAWGGATIKFNNKNQPQDACKGATVNIDYLIN